MFVRTYALKIAKQTSRQWKKESWEKYQSGSHKSRMDVEPDHIDRLMDRASWAIINSIDWGLFSMMRVGSMVFSTMFIFWSNGMFKYALFVIVLNIVSYNIFTKKAFIKYFSKRIAMRDEDDESRSQKSFILPLVQYKEMGIDRIEAIEESLENNRMTMMLSWSSITFSTNLTNGVAILIIFLMNQEINLALFFLIFGSLRSFSNSLNASMNFLNRYSELDENFDTFEREFDKFEIEKDPIKSDMPHILTVLPQTFVHDDFELKIKEPINITRGDRILITGPSRSGKSTFVKGLVGKYKGLKLATGEPENFYHHFVEFFQDISEKTRTMEITVRKLFHEESDDTVIDRYCQIADAQWVNTLKPNKNKKAKYPDWSILGEIYKWLWNIFSRKTVYQTKKDDDLEVKNGDKSTDQTLDNMERGLNCQKKINPYDVKIKGRHSGGEKARLMLATRLYQASSVLILDEFEQGSDPPLAYDIIDRIHNEFPKLTIIVISHLERIHEKEWWDTKIRVVDGVVEIVAPK